MDGRGLNEGGGRCDGKCDGRWMGGVWMRGVVGYKGREVRMKSVAGRCG